MSTTMKVCPCCMEMKHAQEYGTNRAARDGLQHYCKACRASKWADNAQAISQRRRASYLANADARRERARARYVANIDVEHERDRIRRVAGAALRVEQAKQYAQQFPHRKRAVEKLNKAVKRGVVIPWPACAVPDCEDINVHGHHADYSNPLGVTWLCAAHHRRLHTEFIRIHLQGEQA